MAFNKGLELIDGNTVVRDTIVLGGQSQALFQTQLVDGTLQAHGATVFTIRPDDNNDTAGDYQSLLVGQNFVIGLEYNTDGDQYRIVIQSRDDYDTGAGTENPAYGPFVATEAETTFGINLNDNGTITYMHTGSGQQSLSIPTFTPQTAEIAFEETATIAIGDIAHLILDDGRGNLIEVESAATTAANGGELVTALKDAFDALTTEQQSGFTFGAVTNTDEITLSRLDGAGFTVTAGPNHTAAALEDRDNAGSYPEASGFDLSGAPADLFDRDFDGFVSQIATFDSPLTISELSGFVNAPATIPETLVNPDGEDSSVIITTSGNTADDSTIYKLTLDDTNGNSIALDYTPTVATMTNLIAGLKVDFTALSDKAGYTFDDSVDNQIKISRADGADFKVDTTGSTNASDDLIVNGLTLDGSAGESTYSSSNIVNATITLEESATPVIADDTAGVNYSIVLNDGTSDYTLTAYLATVTNTGYADASDALAQYESLEALYAAFIADTETSQVGATTAYEHTNGFSIDYDPGVDSSMAIYREDGTNFTVKLSSDDEADNLEVDGESLATDSTVSSTDGVRSGVPNTISNKVVQNFDFTELDGAETVVGQADDNYAGEDTLIIYGMDKSVGPHASTVAALGSTNGYDGVDSSSYTGTVVVSEGGAVAADVMYAQLREVEDSGVANRQFTADVFIDPSLIVDGDFSALSYTLGWSTDLSIDSITQAVSTGGYKLEDIDVTNDTADIRWFKPTAVTDFSAPIATLVFTDTNGSTDPTLTFTSVDIDGTDFTDGTTYTQSFTDTLDADLWDLGDVLVNGNDSVTAVADQLVVVEGALGGSSAAPAPTSGLYLKLDAFDQDASSDAPDVDYTLGVYSSSATNTVSFEIDLPALVDTSTTFTLDAALTDWTVTSAVVQGRTLVVEASGTTALAVGGSIGQVVTTVTNGFDTTQYFEMVNVQTDADAANENGRGLYVAATRTDTDGTWSVNDMPTGVMTRDYVGTAEIAGTSVTALDAYYALQMSAGLQPNWWNGSFSEGQALAADFDGSGKVTAADALAILQYSVGTVPDPDPVQWVFFDSETTTITNAETVDNIASLASNIAVTASDLTLDQGDEVVLVGDLSDPAG